MTKQTTNTDTTENTSPVHCQICGRSIKNNKNGRIALHGYTRPFDGFQTSSCRGARYLPYEENRNRIQTIIAEDKTEITRLEAHIVDLIANPPAELIESRGSWTKREIKYLRPEGYVHKDTLNVPRFNSYEYILYYVIKDNRAAVEAIKDEIIRLQERYDAWIDPNPAPTPAPEPVIEAAPEPTPEPEPYKSSVNLDAYNKHYNNQTYRLATRYVFSDANELQAGNLLIDATFERLGASRYVGSYDRLIALFDADPLVNAYPETKAELRAQIDAHLANFPDLREKPEPSPEPVVAPEPDALTEDERNVLSNLPTDQFDSCPPYIGKGGLWYTTAEALVQKGYLKVTKASKYAGWFMLTEKGLKASNRELSDKFIRSLVKLAS